jgi:hypothetical protein
VRPRIEVQRTEGSQLVVFTDRIVAVQSYHNRRRDFCFVITEGQSFEVAASVEDVLSLIDAAEAPPPRPPNPEPPPRLAYEAEQQRRK